MKERSIVFSAPEVRATIAGGKTQMRRVVRSCKQFRRWDSEPRHARRVVVADDGSAATFLVAGDQGYTDSVPCPYGKPGDRLWVREAFNWSAREELAPGERGKLCPERTGWRAPFCVYRADGMKAHPEHPEWGATIWKPSTQMPRWASRITLEVTGVRVERLHDISDEDARAEGVTDEMAQRARRHYGSDAARYEALWQLAFCDMWNDGHGCTDDRNEKNGYCPSCWESNPWVWAVEFKVADVWTWAKVA